MIHRNYKGGRPRYRSKNYASLCDTCGAAIPDSRWNKLTCDDTCERAKKHRRTRQEQFWRDYADNKVAV